jgi:glycosyltransferase involved in cell wall biosynthesis
MRKFSEEGHKVYIVTPTERRFRERTALSEVDGISILKVKTLNIQQSNLVEKGLGTLLIGSNYAKAVSKYFRGVKFDLILYSTPPITLTELIKRIKKRNNAATYLLLKDIFPQNAVDIGLIKQDGFLHKYFRRKEKKLYQVSDYIGTMSPANANYLIRHNPDLNSAKVEVCPTSIEVLSNFIDAAEKNRIRVKYEIPPETTVFIYGGNLGKPQGIDFLLEVIESNRDRSGVFFIIAGSGTEFPVVKAWFDKRNPTNAVLIPILPREEYDRLVQSCDVGMIFLDRRFTIPNYPSRLLSYLEYKMPVIAATDPNTDVGVIAQENDYGFWSISGDMESINRNIAVLADNKDLVHRMGENGHKFLKANYTVDHTYRIIMRHFSDKHS